MSTTTLQNAPRDVDKLKQLLKVKQRKKKEEAMYGEDYFCTVPQLLDTMSPSAGL